MFEERLGNVLHFHNGMNHHKYTNFKKPFWQYWSSETFERVPIEYMKIMTISNRMNVANGFSKQFMKMAETHFPSRNLVCTDKSSSDAKDD